MAPNVFVLRPQMRDLAQIFKRVMLRRNGVCVRVIHPAGNRERGTLNFKRLALSLRLHDHARGNYRATRGEM